MSQDGFFNLNCWGLVDPASRAYAQAAFDHDVDALRKIGSRPASWPVGNVDPIHLFACGISQPGKLHLSRHALVILIEHGGQIDAIDSSGWVPLSYSAWFGLSRTLDVLLEANASVHPQDAQPPLHYALAALAQSDRRQGCLTSARLLMMSGADPLRCTINDTTHRSSFLSSALSSGDFEVAELLWARGDTIRTEKELAMLAWSASAPALDWLDEHQYDILSHMPYDHAHRPVLAKAKAQRMRVALTKVARAKRTDLGPLSSEVIEDQQDDRREM